jgi:acyl-CoA dehydrogenase
MEQALPVIIAAEPLERKMLKAIKTGNVDGITWEEQLEQVLAAGNLTAEEAGLLTKARELVLEIIAVDEYESSELRLGVQHSGAMDKQHAA